MWFNDQLCISTKTYYQVTASDGDKDREHNIVYFLTGQGIDADQPDLSKFDINHTSGEIFVLKVSQPFQQAFIQEVDWFSTVLSLKQIILPIQSRNVGAKLERLKLDWESGSRIKLGKRPRPTFQRLSNKLNLKKV